MNPRVIYALREVAGPISSNHGFSVVIVPIAQFSKTSTSTPQRENALFSLISLEPVNGLYLLWMRRL
jgi:hypothetical protein